MKEKALEENDSSLLSENIIRRELHSPKKNTRNIHVIDLALSKNKCESQKKKLKKTHIIHQSHKKKIDLPSKINVHGGYKFTNILSIQFTMTMFRELIFAQCC